MAENAGGNTAFVPESRSCVASEVFMGVSNTQQASVQRPAPLLIGILADVSASMTTSIGSSGDRAIDRLQAFSEALEDFARRAASFIRQPPRGTAPGDA